MDIGRPMSVDIGRASDASPASALTDICCCAAAPTCSRVRDARAYTLFRQHLALLDGRISREHASMHQKASDTSIAASMHQDQRSLRACTEEVHAPCTEEVHARSDRAIPLSLRACIKTSDTGISTVMPWREEEDRLPPELGPCPTLVLEAGGEGESWTLQSETLTASTPKKNMFVCMLMLGKVNMKVVGLPE